jgi:carbonic anhydrase
MRICAALIVCASTMVGAQTVCPPNPNWSYTPPRDAATWVEQWPTCGRGKAQSPVDLPGGLRPQAGPAIEFHYQPFDLVVENTSHVVEVPAAKGGYIVVNGRRYDLVQFHVHTPSEHTISGKASALEIHLVHRDAAGKLAVVGILVREGAASQTLQPIVAALPVASCDHHETHTRFDASALLPAKRDYFTYAGSLTTPSCDEGVTWVVLGEGITVSPAQGTALGPFGVNARPVQPLNGRTIVHVR